MVHEPVLRNRWLHAPMRLCCSLAQLNEAHTELVLHLDKQMNGACMREFVV